MWASVVICEPVGLFEAKEDVKMNAYCELFNEHFSEWLHGRLLAINVRLSTYKKQQAES